MAISVRRSKEYRSFASRKDKTAGEFEILSFFNHPTAHRVAVLDRSIACPFTGLLVVRDAFTTVALFATCWCASWFNAGSS